jgi:16S rRNA (cytosine1402-N4)-methyltransferase
MNASNDASQPQHLPVLPVEVLQALDPQPGQVFVDATVGAGGHCRLIASRVEPNGRVIGLEQDPTMIDLAAKRLQGLPISLVHTNFGSLREVLDQLGIDKVHGILADLGFCSDQMENAERGLSFQEDGPLDMRLDPTQGETAASLIRRLSERDLANVIFEFGEERCSRRIARQIVERRRSDPVTTTAELAELVRRCVPRPKGRGPFIHPATRTFQALRIAVNHELEMLDRLLAQLPDCLVPGGRAAIISFHSLEDRRVKTAFRQRDIWLKASSKPITAGEDEVRDNPRARSAKLRVAELRGESPTPDRPRN